MTFHNQNLGKLRCRKNNWIDKIHSAARCTFLCTPSSSLSGKGNVTIVASNSAVKHMKTDMTFSCYFLLLSNGIILHKWANKQKARKEGHSQHLPRLTQAAAAPASAPSQSHGSAMSPWPACHQATAPSQRPLRRVDTAWSCASLGGSWLGAGLVWGACGGHMPGYKGSKGRAGALGHHGEVDNTCCTYSWDKGVLPDSAGTSCRDSPGGMCLCSIPSVFLRRSFSKRGKYETSYPRGEQKCHQSKAFLPHQSQ